MSLTPLTIEQARQLIGDLFVHHTPFHQELGLKLQRFDEDCVELTFKNQDKLIGNIAQYILHGGVTATVLDVAAGLVCIGHRLMRQETLIEAELHRSLSRIGTIDLRIDYLRPGRGKSFTATGRILRGGNKISVARVELHNEDALHIASATATYLVG